MKAIAISNHNKFSSRKREVFLKKKVRDNGTLFVNDEEIKSFEPSFSFEFRVFYYELIDGVKVYDSMARPVSYSASRGDRIGIIEGQLRYITDPEFPNFQYFPTELEFLLELEDTNQFTIAGQKYSLPKVPDGNGGEREMNEDEITELFVTNLDTRESGSVFIEL